MARPSDYTPEVLEKAREYLNKLPKNEVIHSVEGLADYLGIARSTAYLWRDDEGKEEFSDILEAVLTKQGKSLVNGGLSGKFQPTITKVMITKHGYREGLDQTTNDKDLPVPIMAVPSHVQDNDSDSESREAEEED